MLGFLVGFLVVYVVMCMMNVVDPGGNFKRHLTNEVNYAHYSRITWKNFAFNPQLMRSRPQRFTLTEGEGLLIPPGWWHWARSEPHTFAVNYWTNDLRATTLKAYKGDLIDHKTIMAVIESYSGPIRVWNSMTDEFLETEQANFKDRRLRPNQFIISIGFDISGTLSPNPELLAAIQSHLVLPQALAAAKKVEKNLWISLGKHDTGLHYDDYTGLLIVLKGRKHVTLFPPEDSHLLKPYSVIPEWATRQTTHAISPNVYKLNEVVTSTPSSRLLYESMACQENKGVLLQFMTLLHLSIDAPVVWGCKLKNGVMRWEIYSYHYSYLDHHEPTTLRMQTMLLDLHPHGVKDALAPGAIIHSFDVNSAPSTAQVMDGNVHVYKLMPGTTKQLPIFGEGCTVFPNGTVEPESIYTLDLLSFFKENYDLYMSAIGLENVSSRFKDIILGKYECDMICIHNKYDGNVFVQYLGITASEFLSFLRTFSYPSTLCKHVAETKYEVPHEITIVYDAKTLEPVRTGFYGTLTGKLS